jgi:phospholipid/cholesterol/gamma-HCH transport system ATP-binding protein
MAERAAILEFDQASINPGSQLAGGMVHISLALYAGQIGLIQLEESREQLPIADAAEGLLTPDSGRVLFEGECWENMSPHRQADRRGRIGRVFEHYGWISNLDVVENICLGECHHTHRPDEEIFEQAEALARLFGLSGLPSGRPTRVHSMVLRKLEWVRAFLGDPELVILERPLFGAPRGDAGVLVTAALAAAHRGAAVLWLSDDPRSWEEPKLAGALRFQMQGASVVAVRRETT